MSTLKVILTPNRDYWTGALGGTIGQFVKDLELIALASEPNEWLNAVEYLPF